MASPWRKVQGFTLTELLVTIAVVFVLVVLAFLAVPNVNGPVDPKRRALIQGVNNARQIHLATMSMVNDSEANGDLALGWPGDLKARGKIQTTQDFVNLLVKNDYLNPNDLKAFAAKGIKAYQPSKPDGSFTPPFEEKNNAFKIFLLKKEDKAETLFLASKNFTYNTLLDPKAKPFGDEGFVVCRKGGDVSIYKKQQLHDLNQIGPLPGGGTVENAENCLNPSVAPK